MSGLDIGIDLGTTKTIIYKDGEGEILREPSIVAINTRDDSVMAVGEEAYRMLGRTPDYIRAEYPINDGVISDHILTGILIKECLRRASDNFLVKHRVIICVPSAITDVEKRTVIEVVVNAGGRKVYLIDEPIAAAIGAGIDITQANGAMVVDIGGGTTNIAVISMSGIVVSRCVKLAGNKLDDDLVKYILFKYKLLIGNKMATQLKHEIASTFIPSSEVTAVIKGRNVVTNLPQRLELSQSDIYECVAEFGEIIVDNIRAVLEKTPPELISDIYENGIVLTGGGSLLGGLHELIEERTHVKTYIAENPIECVSIGTGKAFKYIDILQNGFSSESTLKY